MLLHNLLLDLLNHLRLSVLLLHQTLQRIAWQAHLMPLLKHILDDGLAPCDPLVEESASVLHNSQIGGCAAVRVLLVEDLGVLAQVLADCLLLVLGEEGCWAWAPQPLLELLDWLLAELLALEVVEVVTVLLLCSS